MPLFLKSFIDDAADCFDNRRDAERVPSAILLLANVQMRDRKEPVGASSFAKNGHEPL